MKSIIIFCYRIWDLFFDVTQKDIWLFPQGHKDKWESNQRELFEYLLKQQVVQPIVILNQGEEFGYPEKNVIRTDDILSICKVLLKSSVVFLHHGTGDLKVKFFKSCKRTYIFLGHGGLMHKKMGFNELKNRSKKRIRKIKRKNASFDFCYVNSQLDKLATIASLGIPYDRVRVTGMARSDKLLRMSKQQSNSSFEEALNTHLCGRKLLVYAPTWRDGGHGMYEFSEPEAKRLGHLLDKHGVVLGFDGHQYIKKRNIPDGNAFLDLKLLKTGDIENVLRHSILLITDYSSVWVDYLLLDKPVIGYFYDWDEYKSSRGFQMDYLSMFPGNACFNFEELIRALESYLEEGTFKVGERYCTIKKLVHAYSEFGFCEKAYRETLHCMDIKRSGKVL